MARGMHKGPKTRSKYKDHSIEPRVGSNGDPIKESKTTLEKRLNHWDAKGAKTQHNRPGSNKK